jgi:hypothetical protein
MSDAPASLHHHTTTNHNVTAHMVAEILAEQEGACKMHSSVRPTIFFKGYILTTLPAAEPSMTELLLPQPKILQKHTWISIVNNTFVVPVPRYFQ